ncbi:MAG TPA: C-type lectin domain-containing protein, partial [Polyangiaceae bacterium]|nr:C-type lectin domain-containing protein [Polyangiaceae bacterium]
LLTDAGEPVSDAGDAGVLAAQCASTGGALEPGTRDCLFVSAQALSWQNAVNACIARQSTLVAIKTPERDAFITSRLTATVWVGARDPGLNPAANAFVWLDGTSIAGFTNWATAEPDAVADQFCVAKTLDTPAGPWRDRPCSELNAYVCEQTL